MKSLFLAVALLFAVALPASAEEMVVSGYPVGEFAVKGNVDLQVRKLVTRLRALGKGKLAISVVGSADKTGKSDANDQLAEKRAVQVANVLKSEFPEAEVANWSVGDANNVRQVRVGFKFTALALPVQVQAPKRSPLMRFVGACLMCFGAALGFIFYIKKRAAKAKALAAAVETKHLVINGYKVAVELRGDGFWYSPFTGGSGQTIRRRELKDMENSIKGCLTKESFRSQVEALKRIGRITVVSKTA